MPTPLQEALNFFIESQTPRIPAGGFQTPIGSRRRTPKPVERDAFEEAVLQTFRDIGSLTSPSEAPPLPLATGEQRGPAPSLEDALAPQAAPSPQQAPRLTSPLPGSDPRLSPLPGSLQTAPASTFFQEPASTIDQAFAPEPRSILGLSEKEVGDLGLAEGAAFLEEENLVASTPRTGVVDTAALGGLGRSAVGTGQFAGGAGGTLTFGDGTTIDVSGEIPTGGLVIRNPYTDDALSGKQQKDVAEQQEVIQRVASAAKRERLKEKLQRKWQKVRRVLDNPAVSIGAKRQIQNQLQIELQEFSRADPSEMFEVFAAEDSPEVKIVGVKQAVRTEGAALYGSEEIGQQLADSLTLDADGQIDYKAYDKTRGILEDRRVATVQHDRQLQSRRDEEEDKQFKSVRDLSKIASDILADPKNADKPEARAAFLSALLGHQRRFGGLNLAALEGKPFNFETVNQVLFGLPQGARQASAVSVPVSQPSLGTQTLQTNDTIVNATPADLERAQAEVDALHDAGQLNASIRFVTPDGRTGTIK